jgi:hypothetical protein
MSAFFMRRDIRELLKIHFYCEWLEGVDGFLIVRLCVY